MSASRKRQPHSPFSLPWLRCLCVVLGISVCALTLSTQAAVVQGQVFDEEGEPLVGVTVAVFEREAGGRYASGGDDEEKPQLVRVASDRTDEHGLYEIELGARRFPGEVLVGCVEGPHWDQLRYALPEPREVGRALRRGKDVSATFRVKDAPGWRELAREIERAGGLDTKRGKILRKRGHPPEILTTIDGRVEWRYPRVTFVFESGELIDIRRESARASDRRTGGEGA